MHSLGKDPQMIHSYKEKSSKHVFKMREKNSGFSTRKTKRVPESEWSGQAESIESTKRQNSCLSGEADWANLRMNVESTPSLGKGMSFLLRMGKLEELLREMIEF